MISLYAQSFLQVKKSFNWVLNSTSTYVKRRWWKTCIADVLGGERVVLQWRLMLTDLNSTRILKPLQNRGHTWVAWDSSDCITLLIISWRFLRQHRHVEWHECTIHVQWLTESEHMKTYHQQAKLDEDGSGHDPEDVEIAQRIWRVSAKPCNDVAERWVSVGWPLWRCHIRQTLHRIETRWSASYSFLLVPCKVQCKGF